MSVPLLREQLGQKFNCSYSAPRIEYAINRYAMETKRLLDVLDKHLGEGSKQYVCGDQSLDECASMASLMPLVG